MTVQAEHELNTYRAEYANAGINHIEGGWPKDVNINDEEQTKRYRRKIEKDEGYPHIMSQLCKVTLETQQNSFFQSFLIVQYNV